MTPRLIKIENEDDFLWLKNYVDKWRARCYDNRVAYSDHIERFDRLSESFAQAIKVIDPTDDGESVPAAKEKRNRGVKEVVVNALCKEHPKYEAKRRPRTACEGCWKVFKQLNPNRYEVARRDFERPKRL